MKKIFLLFVIIFNSLHGCDIKKLFDKRLFSEDINLVRQAIAEDSDIDGKNPRGFTPLIFASANDRLDIAKLLINSGANLDSQTVLGLTSLIYATIMNREAIVDLLLKSGANPNIKTPVSGRTALMEAALNKGLNINIAKLLIDAGANFYIKDCDGKTALDIAVLSDNNEVAELIKNRIEYLKKIRLDFIKAAQEGDVKKLVQLIELGININVRGEYGFTALIRAAQGSNDPEQAKNKLEIVKILLQQKADFTLKDYVMHYTALKWARESGNTKAVELLKAAGATE